MKKIKSKDQVIVLSGKDKGRSGTVIKVIDDHFVIVEGINVSKKHVRPNPQKQQQGGIVEKELPIHLSNLALLNPITQKADKVGFKSIPAKNPGEKAKKVRYFKSNNEMIET